MILNHQRRVPVSLKPLDDFHRRLCELLRVPSTGFTVCLVSDAVIRHWNRAYRGKNSATDVLSFPFGANSIRRRKSSARPLRRSTAPFPRSAGPRKDTYIGDVAIAPAVARRNARRFGRPLRDELSVLILHGALHLLGFDHETDHGEMNRRERRLRRRLGLPL